MSEDRRSSPRHPASFPAQIETDAGRTVAAIARDIGPGGLLVLSRRALQVGEDVALHLLFESVQYVVTGKVVRQEPLDEGERSLWQTKVALAVDANDPVLAKIFASVVAAG
jgi:Tfp pilus assembly protein PilZ